MSDHPKISNQNTFKLLSTLGDIEGIFRRFDSNLVLRFAAQSGRRDIIDTAIDSGATGFARAAIDAAGGGHSDVLTDFIARATAADQKIDFERIALNAAFGGHTGIVNSIIPRLNPISYPHIATYAARGGHLDIAEDVSRARSQSTEFYAAVAENGNIEYLNRLLEGVDPPSIYWFGLAAGAARGGHLDITHRFIDRARSLGQPQLHYGGVLAGAAAGGHLNVVINIIARAEADGYHFDFSEYREGMDYAAEAGHADVVEYLFYRIAGGDTDAAIHESTLLIGTAAGGGHSAIVLFLLPYYIMRFSINDPIAYAARSGNRALVNDLIARGVAAGVDIDYNEPMYSAAVDSYDANGYRDIVNDFIARYETAGGRAPINVLNRSMLGAIRHGRIEIVNDLVEHGANDFNEGLRLAAGYGKRSLVRYMIDKGATQLREALQWPQSKIAYSRDAAERLRYADIVADLNRATSEREAH